MSLLYGLGPVLEALRAGRRRVHRVWVAEGRREDHRLIELLAAAAAAGVQVARVHRGELDRRAQGGAHQGLVAEAEPLPAIGLADLSSVAAASDSRLILVLDGVQDPQNLGAILRTGECAGASAVVVPRDRAAPLTPAAIKAAEGAAEHVPVVTVVNLRRALDQLKEAGFWVYGSEAKAARTWSQLDLSGPVALVFGAEGAGIRPLVREACDDLGAIPLAGRLPSLNVGAAVAVAAFEVVRQRREQKGV